MGSRKKFNRELIQKKISSIQIHIHQLIRDVYNKMTASEKKNFTRNSSFNPFLNVQAKPGDFKARLKQTWGVLRGKQQINDEDPVVAHEKSKKAGAKMGIFRYLLGIIPHLVYSFIPGFFYSLVTFGFIMFIPADLIFRISGKLPYLGKVLSAPLWLTFGLIAVASISVGGIGYGVTKSILYPINLFIQKVLIPVLSFVGWILALPFVGIVHLILKDKNHSPPSSPDLRGPHLSSKAINPHEIAGSSTKIIKRMSQSEESTSSKSFSSNNSSSEIESEEEFMSSHSISSVSSFSETESDEDSNELIVSSSEVSSEESDSNTATDSSSDDVSSRSFAEMVGPSLPRPSDNEVEVVWRHDRYHP